MISFSIVDVIQLYLSYFDDFQLPVIVSYGSNSYLLKDKLKIPKDQISVNLLLKGFIECSATFCVTNDLQSIQYPVILFGFSPPSQSQKLTKEFYKFVQDREFPLLSSNKVVQQRLKLERRNRNYLLNASKAKEEMISRYDRAESLLSSKRREYLELEKKAENLISKSSKKQGNEKTERNITEISNALDAAESKIKELNEELEEKVSGKVFTIEEEIQLMQNLKKRVQATREKLEELKKTV
ncbi:uncharacterized protein GO595_009667 [Histomonas meleagridis]|uniref:uncharacterized protein n=1 Tax=Histomonas meleagridis TaxID=135588 RepID=UPI00355961FF|nr:hypothetical protein GO595_009667 [Histomonas meleagridis]